MLENDAIIIMRAKRQIAQMLGKATITMNKVTLKKTSPANGNGDTIEVTVSEYFSPDGRAKIADAFRSLNIRVTDNTANTHNAPLQITLSTDIAGADIVQMLAAKYLAVQTSIS